MANKKTTKVPASVGAPNWLTRKHKYWERWTAKEARQRASYVATKELLIPYLVPHRFETDPKKPKKNCDLPRAKLGFGFGMNGAYLAEIFGHIRTAARGYDWGPMEEPTDTEEQRLTIGRPTGGTAQKMWDDATLENTNWTNFFQRLVLEWMLSSPGGFIVTDLPPGKADSQAEELAANKRPYFRFLPMSSVEDLGRGANGFRWVKILEEKDERGPKDERDQGLTEYRLVYELKEVDGEFRTFVTRYDKDGVPVPITTSTGESVNELDMGKLVDRQGQPSLPLIYVQYGEDSIVQWLGGALLDGLDDIIIDMYNTYTEIREGYRDVAFSFLVHKGTDGEVVHKQLKDGSRFITLGDSDDATLTRETGESAEVEAGIQLVELAAKAWALSAKRKAEEATEGASGPRSGISLEAEFALDLVPLLADIAGELDNIESDCMHMAAQLDNKDFDATDEEARDIGVTTVDEFRPEDEASRITRLTDDFLTGVMSLIPIEAFVDVAERWADSSEMFNMDRDVDLADGTTVTFRQYYRDEVFKLATANERERLLAAQQPVGGITI